MNQALSGACVRQKRRHGLVNLMAVMQNFPMNLLQFGNKVKTHNRFCLSMVIPTSATVAKTRIRLGPWQVASEHGEV